MIYTHMPAHLPTANDLLQNARRAPQSFLLDRHARVYRLASLQRTPSYRIDLHSLREWARRWLMQ